MICLLSCKAQKDTKLQSERNDSEMVLIAQDAYSGIDAYEAAVITDAKSLGKFYSRINKTRKPGLPVPEVDFSQEMVVVVCLGERQGATLPKLSKTKESENEVSITVIMDTSTAKESGESQVISSPFYVYKMPRTTKAVHLEKEGF